MSKGEKSFYGIIAVVFVVTMLISGQVGPDRACADSLPAPQAQGVSPRIVGGHDAEKGAWPWIAALASKKVSLLNGQFCGGSLIDPQWVVTAAHCLEGGSTGSFDVVLGAYDLSMAEGTKRVKIKRIIMHPFYNPETVDSDIGIIQLAESVYDYSFAEMEKSGDTLEGELSTVIGWGATNPRGTVYPTILQEVSVPITSNKVCSDAFPPGYGITRNMLCAGYDDGGKDACLGDSGGPLMVEKGGSWRVAGVVSWGLGDCAEAGLYGVYTRASRFAGFIDKTMSAGTFIMGKLTKKTAGGKKAGVSNARVSISQTTLSTTTGPTGSFLIPVQPKGLKAGTYNAVFKAQGFKTAKVTFRFKEGNDVALSYSWPVRW